MHFLFFALSARTLYWLSAPIVWLRIYLRRLAWPPYDCERCVGQDYGCWCDYHGAIAPGIGPEWWRVRLRVLLVGPEKDDTNAPN